MIDEVLAFAIVMSIFEFVVLCMLPPRTRLRVLGSPSLKMTMHLGFLIVNLFVHWGTIVGTMSSTLAFITSLGVLEGSTRLFGSVVRGRYYHRGLIAYSPEELK